MKKAAQAHRLLAIAAALDGATREEAAKMGGMDRQTLRDWVIRFNEQGRTVSSISRRRAGRAKLTGELTAFLARVVEDGLIRRSMASSAAGPAI
jgi:transposase